MLKNNLFSTFCSLVLVCLLAGCSAGRHVRLERPPTVCEARMAQVPFPCGAQVSELESLAVERPVIGGSDYKIWEYQTPLTAQALYDFYRTQTEIEGWRELVVHFTALGDLFCIYQRPKKILVVDGRQQGRQLLVRCFTGSVSKI